MMGPGQVPENEFSPIWKAMIVASFVMLSALTWGMSPLQKLVEKVQHKETIRAQLKVCAEVRSMFKVYEDWAGNLFSSGCVWEMRNILLAIRPEKERDSLRKEFLEQEGSTFESAMNHCSQASAEAMRENKIADRVATPMYFERFDCPKIIEEAEKLGVDLLEEGIVK